MTQQLRGWRRLAWAMAAAMAMVATQDATTVVVWAQDVGTVEGAALEAATLPEATSVSAPEATAATVDTAAPETTAVAVGTAAPVEVAANAATPADTAAPAATSAESSAPEATPVVTATPETPLPEATSTPPSSEAVSALEAASSSSSSSAAQSQITTDAPAASSVPSASPSTSFHTTAASTSSMRGSSSSSGSSDSVTDVATGEAKGVSTSKTAVLCVLGGLGASVILGLLIFLCRRRSREDLDPDTPLPQAEVAVAFAAPSPPPDTAVAQEMAAWKASGSSLASRNLPFTESTRAKLNGSARSSAEYDLSGRTSQLGDLSSRGPPPQRDTGASSEQSFSIRGYSDFSVIRGGDSESSVVMHDRYSRSSLLSIDTGRSNSGWFQRQVPRSLDLHRFSSTSSTASSVVARKQQQQNVASFISHDLTQPPSNRAAVTGGAGSSVDGKDWYSVIESPSDADRFSASSLDSDRLSDDRESFEL